jgi:hypothetical protein
MNGKHNGMILRVKQTDSRWALAPVLDECRAIEKPGLSPSSLPTSFVLAPLALYSGRGAGGEGFTLCFDWFFDREFNV